MCGFCDMKFCVCVDFLKCVYMWLSNVWVSVCVGFLMFWCVYVWIL